jgi:uncharacterized protein (TIGR02466 family)
MPKKPKEEPVWGGHSIFPTTVLTKDWDVKKTNEALKEQLWRERAHDPEGLYRSNLAGTWHSKDNVLQRLGTAGKTLHDMFGQGFTSYAYNVWNCDPSMQVSVRMSAWAMIYEDRGYAAVHTHPNCHTSGVYYVDNTADDKELIMATGVKLRAGDIEFLDTRRGGEFQIAGMNRNPSAVFGYKTGRMVLFPSWLPHYVHPIVGPGERIAIACNATYTLTPKEPK